MPVGLCSRAGQVHTGSQGPSLERKTLPSECEGGPVPTSTVLWSLGFQGPGCRANILSPPPGRQYVSPSPPVFVLFLAAPTPSLWDLTSLMRDRNYPVQCKGRVLTTGSPLPLFSRGRNLPPSGQGQPLVNFSFRVQREAPNPNAHCVFRFRQHGAFNRCCLQRARDELGKD